MPTAMEMALVARNGKEARELCAKLGLELETEDGPPNMPGELLSSDRLKEVDKALEAAHREALVAIGFTVKRKNQSGYLMATGPCGNREFGVLSLGSFRDSELDIGFEEAPWGLSLSSRYFPTFLDWREEHGSPNNFVMDQDFMREVEAMRTALRNNGLGALADLPLAVCLRFY